MSAGSDRWPLNSPETVCQWGRFASRQGLGQESEKKASEAANRVSTKSAHISKREAKNREGFYGKSSPFQTATKNKSGTEEYSLVTKIWPPCPTGALGLLTVLQHAEAQSKIRACFQRVAKSSFSPNPFILLLPQCCMKKEVGKETQSDLWKVVKVVKVNKLLGGVQEAHDVEGSALFICTHNRQHEALNTQEWEKRVLTLPNFT